MKEDILEQLVEKPFGPFHNLHSKLTAPTKATAQISSAPSFN